MLVAGERGPSSVTDSGERFAQVCAIDGELLASTGPARRSRLLEPAELRQAARRPVTVERRSVNGTDVRVRAEPAALEKGGRAVVVLGDSLRERDSSLSSLNRVLLIALPLALLVAAFAGYEVAGAALRPVERNEP